MTNPETIDESEGGSRARRNDAAGPGSPSLHRNFILLGAAFLYAPVCLWLTTQFHWGDLRILFWFTVIAGALPSYLARFSRGVMFFYILIMAGLATWTLVGVAWSGAAC